MMRIPLELRILTTIAIGVRSRYNNPRNLYWSGQHDRYKTERRDKAYIFNITKTTMDSWGESI